VTANAGADVEIDLFEDVSFNGSLSIGNGPIVNYTWTMDNVTQYGTEFQYTFTTPGEFLVNLAVKDRFGLMDNDTVTVTVKDEWPLSIGPVLDTDGAALEGVLVTLSNGIAMLTNLTNATGYAHFLPGVSFICCNVTLQFSKDGYETAYLDARITTQRLLDGELPEMVRIISDFTLSVGPVSDTDGALISGAYVNITVGGSSYQNVTDASGMTSFVLSETDLGLNITVVVEKTGYKRLVHNTRITQAGALEVPLPAMQKDAKPSEDEPFPYWAVALVIVAVLILIFLAVAIVVWRMRSGKKEEAGEEKDKTTEGPEKPADSEDEGADKAEEGQGSEAEAPEGGNETEGSDASEEAGQEYAEEVPMETASAPEVPENTPDAQATPTPETEEGVAAEDGQDALDSLDDLDIADEQNAPAEEPKTLADDAAPETKDEELSGLDDLEDLED
jgi:hypothetical protein